MTEPAWLRRAGRGRLPDGREILWSVAEGGRGRRWRWVLEGGNGGEGPGGAGLGGAMAGLGGAGLGGARAGLGGAKVGLGGAGLGGARAGLVEIDPVGAFTRLELDSAVGMLTLHPDHGGVRLNGNVVTAEGVRPVDLAWRPGFAIAVEDDAFATRLLSGTTVAILVTADLAVLANELPQRLDVLEADHRGVPRLRDSVEWPLEV